MKIVLDLIVIFFAVMIIAIIVIGLVSFITGMLDALKFVDLIQDLIDKPNDLGRRFVEKIYRIVRGD